MTEILLSIFLLPIFVGLLYIAYTDFKKLEIPNIVSLSILGALLVANLAFVLIAGIDATLLFSGVIITPFGNLQVGFIMGLVSLLVVLLSKERAMGQGDVRMLLIAGLMVGTQQFLAFYYVMLAGAITYGLLVGLKQKKLSGVKVPLGTFIVLGIMASFVLVR